jgi:hypothetical protein
MVRWEAGQLTFSRDGEVVLRVRDPEPLPPGGVGMGCLEGSGGAFDNLELIPLHGGEEPGIPPGEEPREEREY